MRSEGTGERLLTGPVSRSPPEQCDEVKESASTHGTWPKSRGFRREAGPAPFRPVLRDPQ